MDVRIGISDSPREVTAELPDDERDETVKKIEAALNHAVEILWLTDKKGRQVAVSAAKISYVEIGTNDGDRRVGFGG